MITMKKMLLNIKNSFQKTWMLWIMVLPGLIAVLVFNYLPMYGIQLAFREYSFKTGISGGEFVGLKYFQQFVSNYQFPRLMKNTFTLCLSNILLGFPTPIFLALLFDQIRSKKFKKISQTISYMPHFVSTVVLVSLLTVLFSPNVGVIGQKLAESGITKINILGSTKTFIGLYIGSEIWQHSGWNCIIYLAALSSVDPQLHDAARIDGANRFQIIQHISMPALKPTIIMLLILSMGSLLNTSFEKIYLMQNSMNLSVSEVINTYVYKIGMESNQFSYAAAIGLFNTLINFAFLIVTNWIGKKTANISIF